MNKTGSTVVLVAACLLATLAARGDAPASRPALPSLTVGGDGPRAFVVDGLIRAESATLAFRVAADGDRHLCTLYDSADGTPVLLTDGARTLLFDLPNDRVTVIDPAAAFVSLGWQRGDDKPMTFTLGLKVSSGSTTAPATRATSRPIDAKADAAAKAQRPGVRLDELADLYGDRLQPTASGANGAERLTATSENGGDTALLERADAGRGFRLTIARADDPKPKAEVIARRIGGPIDPIDVTFPDLDRLRADGCPVTSASLFGIVNVARAPFYAQAMMAKLAAMEKSPEKLAKAMPLVDPTDAARRDRALAGAYCGALAKQGLRFAFDSDARD